VYAYTYKSEWRQRHVILSWHQVATTHVMPFRFRSLSAQNTCCISCFARKEQNTHMMPRHFRSLSAPKIPIFAGLPRSPMFPQKSSTFPQESPKISAKEPYISAKEHCMHKSERKQRRVMLIWHNVAKKTAHDAAFGGLKVSFRTKKCYTYPKRALHIRQRALRFCKKTLHIYIRALCICMQRQ